MVQTDRYRAIQGGKGMIYLLIFYWVFAALFMCGWLTSTKAGWGVYIASFIVGGLILPMLLGLHLYHQKK